MITMKRPCTLCALGLVMITASALGSTERARILHVRQERVVAPAPEPEPAPVELRLEKFLSASTARNQGEVFRVEWRPLGRALEAGTVLRFEYHQERSRKPQQLAIRYPFAVKERRSATFEIAPTASEAGGRVTAWRATVEKDGQVLAEMRSANWTGRPA